MNSWVIKEYMVQKMRIQPLHIYIEFMSFIIIEENGYCSTSLIMSILLRFVSKMFHEYIQAWKFIFNCIFFQRFNTLYNLRFKKLNLVFLELY